MKKWTDYYGGIREVTLTFNKDGTIGGYHYFYTGVCWLGEGVLLTELKGFYDSAEEAVEGIRLDLISKVNQRTVVLAWLENEVKDVKEYIENLNNRIDNLEKEVVR